MRINFNNTYVRLPAIFYTKVSPVAVRNPKLGRFNFSLATELGFNFENLDAQEIAEIFSGNKILEGSEPIALAYAGHQFGYFVPQLGDGRAILLGEVLDKHGIRRDIQLKGSGQTPYSGHGDGRAALGPMVREYVVSEAMHALGIKTTRALAIVTTGEPVYREVELPGSILSRVAESHIRIGTFEYFAAREDFSSLKLLANYVIWRHYPEAKETENPYLALLKCVRDAQVSLITSWMGVGFIHGVMNTDNMALSGETIDYGPCAFMDEYNARKVFSSIDRYGRYAFCNQPSICLWNLIQLGECLAFLVNPRNPLKALEEINEVLYAFNQLYESSYLEVMGQKIGIKHPREIDKVLIEELLNLMQKEAMDYTLIFRQLSYVSNQTLWPFNSIFTLPPSLEPWIKKWRNRLKEQNLSLDQIADLMLKNNPAIIPRNHKLKEVIQYTMETSDFNKMDALMTMLANPYDDKVGNSIEYMRAPTSKERVHQTFCGT